MRTLSALVLMSALVLGGCSGVQLPQETGEATPVVSASQDTSLGASVPANDPALSAFDLNGCTPDEVLLAYVRARNRSDWRTAYALVASPKDDYPTQLAIWNDSATPMDDFTIYETRIVEADRALVRVSYSTIGFSSLEGVPPEEQRGLVVVRDPGEWWVLEKQDDGLWAVTFKGPFD
ncbi:MAG: hypothetical protein LLG24_03110 [Actinomycetia bacterium]|nr:hypothetical protein [Actinomycetes bacterium]